MSSGIEATHAQAKSQTLPRKQHFDLAVVDFMRGSAS